MTYFLQGKLLLHVCVLVFAVAVDVAQAIPQIYPLLAGDSATQSPVVTTFLNGTVGEDKKVIERTLPPWFDTREGNLSAWIKFNERPTQSMALASLRWHSVDSYMALSYGWWEPLGEQRLYFILSNKDEVHCSVPFTFEANEWFLISVNWFVKERNSHCEIFVDGIRVAHNQNDSKNLQRYTAESIVLGSDLKALDNRNRQFSGEMKKVYVRSERQSEQQIRAHFSALVSNQPDSLNKESWLTRSSCSTATCKPITQRYIFDEDVSWALSRSAVQKRIKAIERAGFNHYVVNVWHGMGARYPTDLVYPEPRVRNVLSSGFDPLAELVRAAHEANIKVHLWFTISHREDDRLTEFFDSGTPEGAFNIHLPAFRQFMIDLIGDVVARYDIDGLNLDYVRTIGVCTSSFCEEDYYKRTGYRLSLDLLKRFAVGDARARIQNWQDAAVDDVVKGVASLVRDSGKNIVLSVDAHPKLPGSHRPLQGRNSLKWLESGWIDAVFSMDYARKLDYEKHRQLFAIPNVGPKIVLLAANYDLVESRAKPREPDYLADLIDYHASNFSNSQGLGFYLYNQLTERQIRMLSSHPRWRDKSK